MKIRAALQDKLEKYDTGNDDNLPIKSTHYGGIFDADSSGIFDMVVCLHSQTLTPIAEVLEVFVQVLKKNVELAPNSVEIISKESSIQFQLKNGVQCVLRVHKETCTEIKRPAELMRKFGANARYYSSRLFAKHMKFMESINPLALDIASILNYWLRSLDFKGETFFDSNIVMELLSAFAVINLATRKEESVFDGFCQAVDELCRLSTLRVGFCQESGQWKTWKNVNSRHKLPFILPPLDPMENAIGGFSVNLYETLQLQALILKGRTVKMLQKREYCSVDRNHSLVVEFDRLLEPTSLQIPLDFGKDQAAAYIVIGYGIEHGDTRDLPSEEHKQALELLRNRLCDVIPTLSGPEEGTMRQFKATSSRSRLNKKITMITKLFVKKSLPSVLVNGVTRSDLKMEWFDYSFIVPYRQLDGMLIRVGFKWNAKNLQNSEKFMFY